MINLMDAKMRLL